MAVQLAVFVGWIDSMDCDGKKGAKDVDQTGEGKRSDVAMHTTGVSSPFCKL